MKHLLLVLCIILIILAKETCSVHIGRKLQATADPSSVPSGAPVTSRSKYPSNNPSAQPIISKSSSNPSSNPSAQPIISKSSSIPSSNPSAQPILSSISPSSNPSGKPLMSSSGPSANPSGKPSNSLKPSSKPSASDFPSSIPSISKTPSIKPTLSSKPSFQPFFPAHPSLKPSKSASAKPSIIPSVSFKPSGKPSGITNKNNAPSQPPSINFAGPPLQSGTNETPSVRPSFITICYDIPWVDSDGDGCSYYESIDDQGRSYCSLFGGAFENNGLVANDACCICGGGTDVPPSRMPSSAPTLGFTSGQLILTFSGSFPGCKVDSNTSSQFKESMENFVSVLLGQPIKAVEVDVLSIEVSGASCSAPSTDDHTHRILSDINLEKQARLSLYTVVVTVSVAVMSPSHGTTVESIGIDIAQTHSEDFLNSLSADVDFFATNSDPLAHPLTLAIAGHAPSIEPSKYLPSNEVSPSSRPSKAAASSPNKTKRKRRWFYVEYSVAAVAILVMLFLTYFMIMVKRRQTNFSRAQNENSIQVNQKLTSQAMYSESIPKKEESEFLVKDELNNVALVDAEEKRSYAYQSVVA